MIATCADQVRVMAAWLELAVSSAQHSAQQPQAAVFLILAVVAVIGVTVRPICRLLGLRAYLRFLRYAIDHHGDYITLAAAGVAMAGFEQRGQVKAAAEASKQVAEDLDVRQETSGELPGLQVAAAGRAVAAAIALLVGAWVVKRLGSLN